MTLDFISQILWLAVSVTVDNQVKVIKKGKKQRYLQEVNVNLKVITIYVKLSSRIKTDNKE